MDKPRGSQHLVGNLTSKAGTFKDDDLQRLLDLAQTLNVDLTHWFPHGTPVPELIHGAFRGSYDNIGQFAGAIFKLEGVFAHVNVFPYGIPAINGADLRLELRSRR